MMTNETIDYSLFAIIDDGSHLIADMSECDFRKPFLDLQKFCDFPEAQDVKPSYSWYWFQKSRCDSAVLLKNLATQSISAAGIIVDMIRQFTYLPIDLKD